MSERRNLDDAYLRLDRLLALEGFGEWGSKLQCPVCGYDYVHFGAPEYRESDGYSAWSGRGAAIYIPMTCEGNHAWMLRIGFHKGQSFLDVILGEDGGSLE